MGARRCWRCKEVKSSLDFYGRKYECKDCNREMARIRMRLYRQTDHGQLIDRARRSAFSQLIRRHKAEYESLIGQERQKLGL